MKQITFFFAVSLFLITTRAWCGVYSSLGANWNNFVFEPLEEEETSNYYGYGARGSFGYSVNNIWDIGLYGHYSPGKLSGAELNREDARLWHFGVETGVRFSKVLFLGLRGGPALYRLVTKNEAQETEGQWTGQMVQTSIGLLLPVAKDTFWQLTMDLGQAAVKSSDDVDAKIRKVSEFSLTLSFVYNGLFKDFLESRLF